MWKFLDFYGKNAVCSAGFSNVWYAQNVPNQRKLFLDIKQRLCDVFIQEKDAFFARSSKCYVYKYLYDPFGLQYYLKKCISENIVHYLTKYRLSAHRLAIKQSRYNQTLRSRRICRFCTLNRYVDKYHFILECPKYSHLRCINIKKYCWSKPSCFKLVQLLSSRNKKQLKNICIFLKKATEDRNNLL